MSPRKGLNALLGASLALIAATLMVLLFEFADDTVKSAREAQDLSGLPALGRVEAFGRVSRPGDLLQAALKPRSAVAEDFRVLRTNLANALARLEREGRRAHSVLFSGSAANDGTTATVANLAVMYGLAGYRVVAIDANLRNPDLHRVFALDNAEGLSTLLLADGVAASRVLQPTSQPNVAVLSAGPASANPAELLGSRRMPRLLEELQQQFDLVLIDTPPVLSVTDASVVAALVDANVLVMRPGRTRARDLHAAVEQLASSGRPVAGLVLNRDSVDGEVRYAEVAEVAEASLAATRATSNGRAVAEDEPLTSGRRN